LLSSENETAKITLELIRIKTPRSLSPEQIEKFVSTLKPFAGVQFDCAVNPGDAESANFLSIMEVVLIDAGWKQVDWDGGDIVATRPGKPTWGYFTLQTVGLGYDQGHETDLGPAAKALGSLLAEAGFGGTTRATSDLFINKQKTAIHLVVGRKG
jgi:hypothetical protein